MLEQFESRWTVVQGLRMHAKVCQAGVGRPAAVLVHGVGVSHRYWAPTAELLAQTHDVYLPDLPGFGKSEKPPHSLNVDEHAEVLCGWMAANGLEGALLMGNSMGCQVVTALAARYPEKAAKLVLTGPTVDRWRRSMPAQMICAALDWIHEPPRLLAIIFWDYLVAGPRRTLITLKFAVQDKPEERLGKIHVPVLVVRGEHDWFVSPEWAAEVAGRLPQGRLVTIPGTAHGLIFSKAAELVKMSTEDRPETAEEDA